MLQRVVAKGDAKPKPSGHSRIGRIYACVGIVVYGSEALLVIIGL